MRLSDFWTPLSDKHWRVVHVLAHAIGGIAIAAFIAGPWIAGPWHDLRWKRLLWVFVFQALWERIQVENWKDSPQTYPWWSAVWDVLLTLIGWGIFEVVRVLI